jgi:Lipopolysaccharide kinase (Kdo/WaaP) family
VRRCALFIQKPVPQYISERDGAWRLWFRSDLWNRELWGELRDRLEAERPGRHPRTVEICLAGAAQPLFLKAFYGASAWASFKDFFRRSKAVRSLVLTESFAGLGFNAPIAIGAGEERYANLLRRSFVVTLPVHGCPLPVFLRNHWEKHTAGISLRQKRHALARLAVEIRRLHDLGFVHGDLVPGNIFVAPTDGSMDFCFMDNDRTRRYPTWLPHRLWRRNLVQLNRFPLAGISLQDRMRFFHAYTRRKKLARRDRKLIHWLEQKTRQRRRECDAVDASGSFRRLMRWDAPGH